MSAWTFARDRAWPRALGLAALLGGGLAVALTLVPAAPKNWDTVDAGKLYRSGQIDRSAIRRALEDHGVDVIVNLTSDELDDPDKQAERDAAVELGIERYNHHLETGDGIVDPSLYVAPMDTILRARDAGKTVLVHCGAGAYRTGVAVALYRVLVDGTPVEQAREEMFEHGVKASKRQQLADFLDTALPVVAQGLAARGWHLAPDAPADEP